MLRVYLDTLTGDFVDLETAGRSERDLEVEIHLANNSESDNAGLILQPVHPVKTIKLTFHFQPQIRHLHSHHSSLLHTVRNVHVAEVVIL